MNVQPKAQWNSKPPARKFHPGQHEAFDDDHNNDDPRPRRGWWEERDDGHRHHDHHRDPANSPEPQSEPQSEPQHGMIAAIGGSAAAAGETTGVSGFIEHFANDNGNYSIAMGEAIFEAWAYSSEPGGAVVAVDTFLDVSGVDFVFAHEIEQSRLGLNDAWARSELDYFAIDIDGWSPRHGPIVIELDRPFDHDQPSGQPCARELPFNNLAPGNLAQVLATSEAHGANTLSATLTNALTVENQFSFVTATGLVAL